ncbi:MAG TPA: PDZ domain-containing protein, partial [Candidatus Eremiobacteraceae bacterium]|nr:PDZ domain-containing protein [Candidatus Eremiobacteraceae bacterium]
NSGGPLANASGEVVGINAMVVNGLAIAVSAQVVRRFLASPDARPHLGIVTRAVEVPVMGERRGGMLVLETQAAGAAERAGVMAGDVVIGVEGRLFESPSDLGDEVDAAAIGAALRLDVVRAGLVIGIDIVVGGQGRKRAA